MNAALNHISASQLQADALRAALRNPSQPSEPKVARLPRTRRLLYRLRPAIV
jgi:hypothetical protein